MTGRAARVQAYAKLNLRLKVLAREAGGFHSLETIFVRIALADTVLVRTRTRGETLRVTGDERLVAAVGPLRENLALRAASMYVDATGWPSGYEIEIRKRIPIGAGLGGGSANAAAVLRALQALSPAAIAEGDLLRIAASLGADVPFLTTSHSAALAWGRGERMVVLPPLPERDVALLTPRFRVSTGEAYGWLDATDSRQAPTPVAIPLEALADWNAISAWAENDFEVAVISQHPEIAEMLAALSRAGARIARMTGSGSTAFGVFEAGVPREILNNSGRWDLRETKTLSHVVAAELSE